MSDLPDVENYFDWDGLEWQDYKKDLADWFKRCIAARPTITPTRRSKWTRGMTGDETMNRYPIHPTHEDWVKWHNKWFSQFR